jgi:DNA segregation ATPase FtsK/SpoIIIE-like protein
VIDELADLMMVVGKKLKSLLLGLLKKPGLLVST